MIASHNNIFGKVGSAVANGLLSSTVTQGIGVATGLQDKFSWAGVAAAGVAAGVGTFLGDKVFHTEPLLANQSLGNVGRTLLTGAARTIASAATRSLIEGSDFGDNVVAGLPDVIGQTIADLLVGGIASKIDARKSLAAARKERAGLKLAYGTDVPNMPGQPVIMSDVNPALTKVFLPKALKAEELVALQNAGYDDAKIRQMLRVEQFNGQFYVTALRGGGPNGSHILDLRTADTSAFLHIHYNGLVPQPHGGDNSSTLPNYRIPAFVYGSAPQRLFEVYRQNGSFMFGTVSANGTISNINPYKVKPDEKLYP